MPQFLYKYFSLVSAKIYYRKRLNMPHVNNFPTSVVKNNKMPPEMIENSLETMQSFFDLPPIKKGDCEGLQERLDNFFSECSTKQMIPSVELLSCALGVSRQTIWQWENSNDKEFARLIIQAKNIINALMVQGALTGNQNFAYTIWLQKNNYGYKENMEIDVKKDDDLASALLTELPKLNNNSMIINADDEEE